jgi:hypothetical protein
MPAHALRVSLALLALCAHSLAPHARAQEPSPSPRTTTRAARNSQRPLWPGSRFTERDRERAVLRGLRFIYATALDEANFENYGSDYLWCFYTVSASVAEARTRREARTMGVERARHWRRKRREVPAGADAQTIADLAFGHDAATSLGLPDPRLAAALRRAAARFTPRDFMHFDPAREPPPSDVPEECRFDHTANERGAKTCRRCGRELRIRTKQDVWYDALIIAYSGERAGVPLGASYEEVFRWLPTLRPYRAPHGADDTEFYDTAYALTHVVYTLNDYGQLSLARGCLPREFEFLRASVVEAIRLRDPDMLGELIDSLRAFGLTERDPEIRAGVEYLLSNQNPDGSWGDAREQDIYLRYHPTWGGVAALSRYQFARGRSPRFARVCNLPGIRVGE